MGHRALITGVTGQDGYYLTKLLLSKGYSVLGHTRNPQEAPKDLLKLPVTLTNFDLHSSKQWLDTLEENQIDEIYHLAGVSFVPTSWNSPHETIAANLGVTLQILESLRAVTRPTRFFYACSSEVFGQPWSSPQNEETPYRPLNPYGVTKAASLGMIESYRKRYGVFACSGILFNHESPRRAPTFVTRKITQAAAAIRLGLQDRLVLGNLDVARDWGYAADYVECMHSMLAAEHASDFVIGTGKLTSLERVVATAFNLVDLDWKEWVVIDPQFVRANEAKAFVADSSKALRVLGWSATTDFESVIAMMVKHDLHLLQSYSAKAA